MPAKREPPARPQHDASYKSFFARRRTVADTLRAFASDITARLDFVTLERMPASFVTRALDQRHADMLWRVRTRPASTAGPRPPMSATCWHRRPTNCLDTFPATGIF